MTEVRVPRVYQLTQQPSYEDHLPLFKIESDNPLFLATTGKMTTSSRYCLIPNKTHRGPGGQFEKLQSPS